MDLHELCGEGRVGGLWRAADRVERREETWLELGFGLGLGLGLGLN